MDSYAFATKSGFNENNMVDWLRKRREYANFFEAPDKELKELMVSEEWVRAYGSKNGYESLSLRKVDDQWPDCEISTLSGKVCGIEVTELVDRERIAENEKLAKENKWDYRCWNHEEIVVALGERLKSKSIMSHGGK